MYEKKSLFALCLAAFANAYATTYIFSYVGFLVVDISELNSKDEAGYLAGFISSALFLGRVISSSAWGWLADTKGRRPVLLLSLLFVTALTFSFGFIKSIFGAIFCRFLLGLCNGSVLVCKTLAPEITTGEHRAMAMSFYSACWSLGIILGPAISGWTVISSSDMSASGDFTYNMTGSESNYKYTMPSLIASVLAGISVLVVFLFLPETLETKKNKKYEKIQSPEEEGLKEMVEQSTVSEPDSGFTFCQYKFCIVLLVYCVISYCTIFMNEVIPLWTVASSNVGGLDYTASETGTFLAAGGVFMFFTSLLFFPYLSKKLQLITILSAATASYALFVLLEMIQTSTIGLFICNCFRVSCESVAFNAIFNLTNNSIPQKFRGRANGVSMLFASVAKMLGPSSGAYLFALSLSNTNGLNWRLAFYIEVILMFGISICAKILIPPSTNEEFIDASMNHVERLDEQR